MKYLGVDYGLKKIGLAISEGKIASLYKVLEVSSLKDSLDKVKKIIKEEGIDRVVVGMPEGRSGKIVKKFAKELKKKVYVVEVDETLSSIDAKKLMIELNTNQKQRKKEDAYAAAIILQNFLDSF